MRVRVNPEKRGVRSYGVRAGWWYCIPSVFVQINIGKRYWSFWTERGDKRWTPAELSADRRVEQVEHVCGYCKHVAEEGRT